MKQAITLISILFIIVSADRQYLSRHEVDSLLQLLTKAGPVITA